MVTRSIAPAVAEAPVAPLPEASPAPLPIPTPKPSPAPKPTPAPRPPATREQPQTQPAKEPPSQATERAAAEAPTGGAQGTDPLATHIEAPPGVIAGPADFVAPVMPAASRLEALVIANSMKEAPEQAVNVPRSVRVVYVSTGSIGGTSFSVPATLNWRHDQAQYNLTWDMFSQRTSGLRRSARGLLTEQGLAPVSFSEERQGAMHQFRFDYANKQLIGAVDATPVAFEPGTQDNLGLIVQLAAMVAADASLRQPGTRLMTRVTDGASAKEYEFVVGPEEVVTGLRGKSVPTLPLHHNGVAEGTPSIQLWLAPSLDYMPVRLRIEHSNGDMLDHLAQNAYQLSVPDPEDQAR